MTTWHNFRTGKMESGIPENWHDVIPQDKTSQDLYDSLLDTLSPEEAVITVLSLNSIAASMAITMREKKHRMN